MPVERITVKKLICDPRPYGLGFCCTFAFFKLHKQTGLIAARLGIGERTVRYHKMAFKDGCLKCQEKGNCLKGKLF